MGSSDRSFLPLYASLDHHRSLHMVGIAILTPLEMDHPFFRPRGIRIFPSRTVTRRAQADNETDVVRRPVRPFLRVCPNWSFGNGNGRLPMTSLIQGWVEKRSPVLLNGPIVF